MDMRRLPVVIRHKVPTAFLPNNYIVACNAIKACARVDEAAEMANKAAAIATYAREAADTTLKVNAEKIKVRAERRVGELLLELYPGMERGKWDGTYKESSAKTGLAANRISIATRLTEVPESRFEKSMDEVASQGNVITPRRVIAQYRYKTSETVEKIRRKKRKEDAILEDVYEEMASEVIRTSYKMTTHDSHYSHKEGFAYSWNDAALGCKDQRYVDEFLKALDRIEKNIPVLRELFIARSKALQLLERETA